MKMLKARAERLLADPDLKIRFVEQGGIKIKNLLVKANPFPTTDYIDALCPICKKTSVSEPGNKPTYRTPCTTEGLYACIAKIKASCQLMKGKLVGQPKLGSLNILRH